MKLNIIAFFILLQFAACSNAQEKKVEEAESKQHLAICISGKGCEIFTINISAAEADKLLGKNDFWTKASDTATLILENCESRIDEKSGLAEIDKSYGGDGNVTVASNFNLEKYVKDKGCFSCPNATKKISFFAKGNEGSGNGFFYLNLKAGEAYMPNEAFQQFSAGQEGAGEMVVDQFIRNNQMETYTIAEGNKYHTKMALATTLSMVQHDAENETRFKRDFKKTGKTRKHLQTAFEEVEYTGKDDEGKLISFWIVPSTDVCLPPGKFDAFGFYNLGYISLDGITHLVTEISGPGVLIKITGIQEGTYNFNSAGYKSY